MRLDGVPSRNVEQDVPRLKQRLGDATRPALLAIYLSYTYVLLEWLFLVTGPSFMASFTMLGKAGALAIPPLALASVAAASCYLAALVPRLGRTIRWDLVAPTALAVGIVFLLIDNFLYTVAQIGAVHSRGVVRGLYSLLLALLVWRLYGHVLRNVERPRSFARHRIVVMALLASSFLALVLQLAGTDFQLADAALVPKPGQTQSTPDIIFLGADGVESTALSVYGLPYDSTPFLVELAESSLVFDNAFANSGKTTGSTTAMLSGIDPIASKVGFPPQIVHRSNSFRHLPALLRRLGYSGYQHGFRVYADAGDLNMQGGFEYSNGRRLVSPTPGSVGAKVLLLFNSEYMFSTRMLQRIGDRLLHVTWIRKARNPFLEARNNVGISVESDLAIIEDAIRHIRSHQGPYFMHLHLMNTHCCGFRGARNWFGTEPPARYLNAIREADAAMKVLVDWLEHEGRLDRTLLVISSDHTSNWSTIQRVPLVIRLPGGQVSDRVSRNVSLVDLPATILDFMGYEAPGWMDGRSLLGPDPEPAPLVTLARFDYPRTEHSSQIVRPGPPHFGVAEVAVIACDRWSRVHLPTGQVVSGSVAGHSAPCDASEILTDAEVRRVVKERLESHGYRLAF